MDSSRRYFGCVVGFGFGVVWMTVGLGSAILCALLAGLGYGAVFVAERARANGSQTSTPSEALAVALREFELENDDAREAADDATSPLAAEADYGWPLEELEVARVESR